MLKNILSSLLTGFVLLLSAGTFLSEKDSDILVQERRMRAEFPSFPQKIRSKSVKNYFRKIEAFQSDHFLFRTEFITAIRTFYRVMGESLNADQCIEGQDGWLFLGNAHLEIMDKLRGFVKMEKQDLEKKVKYFSKMNQKAGQMGAQFHIIVGPNKATIYPEYLPVIIKPYSQRYITPLARLLTAEALSFYDPSEDLLKAKQKQLLYFRTDSHWNLAGAFIAANGIRKHIGLPPPDLPVFEPAGEFRGELIDLGGYDSFPLRTGDNFTFSWPSPPQPDSRIIWIFGDSFSEALRPYLSVFFAKAVFYKHAEFDTVMEASAEKPDIILYELVERGF